MRLPLETYAVIAVYILLALTVGVVFARRAGRDVEQFFLSGRSLPWCMAGTSMVATTFVSDTPLVITGWVRAHGIYQNWMWRCLAAGGLLTAFLFARYWRRGGVMTSAELAELRYGGSEARAALRAGRVPGRHHDAPVAVGHAAAGPGVARRVLPPR
jgi:Na+/proline symporter